MDAGLARVQICARVGCNGPLRFRVHLLVAIATPYLIPLPPSTKRAVRSFSFLLLKFIRRRRRRENVVHRSFLRSYSPILWIYRTANIYAQRKLTNVLPRDKMANI